MNVARILGIPFSTGGFEATVSDLTNRVLTGNRTHVVTANPEIVMIAMEHLELRGVLEQAYVVPDGIGIVYAAKWLNAGIRERVAGIELMEALMEQADRHEWKVYLLGASADVNRKAASALAGRFPRARIVGARDGFFQPEEQEAIVREINSAKPHLLFVALGSPKQETWISANWDKLQVPLAMGVGGSFDVWAGSVKRAPLLWQKLHLEWLYRLLQQPSRWRRQLAIPRFVFAVWRSRNR